MSEEKHIRKEEHARWGGMVGDAVLGANDGIITTFAVVAGVTGASLPATIVLIIGIANIVADGLSMALGNYLGKRAERNFIISERKREEWEIENRPEEEIGEIRQIFKEKGFEGEELDRVVKVIISDKKRWVNAMMRDELNLNSEESYKPVRSAITTFSFFVLFGSLPLVAYLPFLHVKEQFIFTVLLTAFSVFLVGLFSGFVTKRNIIISGLEMLFIGAISAGAAYFLGAFISNII